jgi:hypothetical protein
MPDTFASFNAKLSQLEKSIKTPPLARIGNKVKGDVDNAVRGDIGDLSMSGWRRGNPIQIQGAYKVLTPTSLEIAPTPRSRGPMRVLEQGRHAGGGFQGPGVNRSTGLTARTKGGRVRKVRANGRWNGRTDGKDTWSDAVRVLEKKVPRLMFEELQRSMGRLFGRG